MKETEMDSKPCVLLVDDRPDNLCMLQIILEPLDLDLIEANSGRDALQKIVGKEIALALVDIRMPLMTGVELASIIQKDNTRDKIPIIFITGQAQDEIELEKCYQSGAVDFILKPFNSTILVSKVKVFLELYRQKREIRRQHRSLKKNEDFLNNIVENLPLMLFLKDATDLRFVRLNKAGEDLLGYSNAELIGKSDYDFFKKEEAEFFITNDRIVLENMQLVDIPEERIQTKNYGERILHTKKIPILNEASGRAEFLLGISEDITVQKQVQEEFRNIFDLSSDLVCIVDLKKITFRKVNPAFARILGHPEADFIGISLLDFIHPDDRKRTNECFRNELRVGREVVNLENRYLCSNGNYRWINWVAHSIPERGVAYAIGHDITNRKATEFALAESEKMYRTLLNASPEGIIIMDIKGHITEISNITMEIFGVENKDEFIGALFFKYIPQGEMKKVKDLLERTQVEGLVQNVELFLTKKNQTQFICELSTTLIQEADGKPKAFMAVVRDISQRKRIEQQLLRTEKMISLGEMASAMAHEINQPLLSISLGIENLFQKMQLAKVVDKTYFHNKSEKIFEDIQRIGRIIDHVRAFSRDHDDYIFASFEINESIANAISMISEQFKYHGILLSFRQDKKMSPVIGNTYKFEQVILNLLNNAKDALEEKRKHTKHDFRKTIRVRTFRDKHTNYVEVKDNGVGIKPEEFNRILLPFYTTKDVGKGTGLGLSISFGIIKEMSGNIDISSDPMTGTVFTIALPVHDK